MVRLSNIKQQEKQLQENSSQAMLRAIQEIPITTPFSPEPILTSYVQQGQGNPPLLLLHGFDSSLMEFRRLIPQLSPYTTIYSIDLLGFGFTERKPHIPISADTIKSHLYHFWKTIIQTPVILLGASMGGATAIDLTLTYPNIVQKLILLDSAGLSNPPRLGKWLFPPLEHLATNILKNPNIRQNISKNAYYNPTFASEDALTCASLHLQLPYWHESLISFTKNGGYGNYQNQLNKITQPTLILWGEQDRILGTKPAQKFQHLIPNSQLKWIANCGHVPHLEQPKITADLIQEFFSQ